MVTPNHRLSVMSTNAIIEILRAHEDPCAILERRAPCFAPFELEVALKYAADQYGEQSPILLSVLIASLRAHHKTLWWARMPPPRRYHYENIEDERVWGAEHIRERAATPLRVRRYPYFLCCTPDVEQGQLTLAFEHESYEQFTVYQAAFGLGLEDHGASLTWRSTQDSVELIDLHIQLKDWERLVGMIEALILGDQIISFDHAERQWKSGPLLERAWQKTRGAFGLLEHWLDPSSDDDDIPF